VTYKTLTLTLIGDKPVFINDKAYELDKSTISGVVRPSVPVAEAIPEVGDSNDILHSDLIALNNENLSEFTGP
jgi:hypothetical protein